MTRPTLLSLAIASLLAATSAHASIDLIAIDGLSGNSTDRSVETAASLENGAPGNLLGGLGSGLAYAGGNTFLALPDRGPNAIAYNSAVSDTTSYIDRFQTITMKLAPSAPGSALPFALVPTLTRTTLLHAATPLAYGNGVNAGLAGGEPALNRLRHTRYFTGRSDGFAPDASSTSPLDARLDPEGIRVGSDGAQVFVSDEYGPYVYRFSRNSGERTGIYKLPDAFAVNFLSPVGNDEIAHNSAGRVANKGMEGLAITPDGKALYGAMQSPLLQDGGTAGAYTRIVRIDLQTGATRQYAYQLTNIGTDAKPKYPTISDIVAINDHEFLVDERDGKGLGDGSVAAYKRLYRIDLAGAPDAGNASGAANLAPLAVGKTLFLDLVQALGAHGIPATEIPAKLEGLAFGPDVVVDRVRKHTLFVSNDNDFVGTVTDGLHPGGVANPNLFFVFSVDAADLPTYVAQRIVSH